MYVKQFGLCVSAVERKCLKIGLISMSKQERRCALSAYPCILEGPLAGLQSVMHTRALGSGTRQFFSRLTVWLCSFTLSLK